MFKIISAEIKKIVSKPGIYILSILLAIILILGVFIYKPTVYKSTQFELSGSTFLEKYSDFNRSDNAGKKAEGLTKLDNSIQAVKNYYITSEKISQEDYISSLVKKLEETYLTYKSCITDNSYQEYIDNTRIKLVNCFKELNTAIENALINTQNGSFSLITSKQNYNDYRSVYKDSLDWCELSVEKINLREHFSLFEEKYKNSFYNCINNFKYPSLSNNFIDAYTSTNSNSKLSKLNQRLDEILEEIEINYDLATSNLNNENVALVNKMDELANLYVNTIDTYTNLIKYELICNAFSILSTKEQLNALHLSDYSNYNSKSLLERYDYLFKHNKSENDFSHPLTIGVASNSRINGYDYAYFVLKIFSFVIIIYAIMSACHSIAGEVKDGTMRYLAIRPVSRTQMLLGKWLAIIIMSSILILFSGVISTIVGWACFDLETKTILTIFNGSFAITLHPIAMIGIYLISMLLELIVYSAIAILISTLIKSDLLGMTLMMMLYLFNILLPMFVQGSNTWLAFYPFSHFSIYSLFGSSVYAVSGNFFNLIFGSKVYAGTHAALTISLLILVTIIVGALAIKMFKKKEL